MKRLIFNNRMLAIGFVLAFLSGLSCSKHQTLEIASPGGLLSARVFLLENGQAAYQVLYDHGVIIDTSTLGFTFTNSDPLEEGLRIMGSNSRFFSEKWEMPWGEQRYVDNTFNEMQVDLQENEGLQRKFSLIFRLYDDGIGFRFHFPEQTGMDELFIAEENTYFRLTGDHECWWTPGDWDIYEHLYSKTLFSEIDALAKRSHPNLAQTHIPVNAMNTPVTMRTENGLHLSFHEAALIDYAGITLEVDHEKLSMRTNLVGSENAAHKVSAKTPFSTPWRMIQVADQASDLIASRLILNLNEPNKLKDLSWLKPSKYIGIWWEMHIGKSTWDYGATQDMNTWVGLKAHGRHGATTENALRYIDFAAENNIGAVLVEGWNTGWESWIGTEDREGIFDFVTPYPDYDLFKLAEYAREKNVNLIMHHETSAAVTTYDEQLDTAYQLIERLGINAVKTGYVGTIIPKGEYHNGQYMVNHYQRVLEKAAKHKVAVNSHETVMATGLRRTYPNFFSSENLRGQEFNAWATDGGNPPGHLPTVAFTRMLAGPIDYTPGIFNIKLNPYKQNNQVNTTLAHQLALYVVVYSPLQMAADLPEHYEGHPAFQFIRDVGVDWEQTIVLNGEVGEFVAIAREERNTGNWFLGTITNEEAREITINTSFLDPSMRYKVIKYADAPDSHWDLNPESFIIESLNIDHNSEITLKLAPGGGAAISFMVDEK